MNNNGGSSSSNTSRSKSVLPDISDLKSKSDLDRIIIYRKFFAELRLSRLYFQLSILDYFAGIENPNNKNNFSKELDTFVSFYEQMEPWLEQLRKEGIYLEFKDQCLQEINAIKVIIQSYEGKMKD
jgi:hypothetical protein